MRPDWLQCIRKTYADARGEQSWCGRTIARRFEDGGFQPLEAYFTSLDHAALNGANEGRLVACPDCVAAALTALRAGAEGLS